MIIFYIKRFLLNIKQVICWSVLNKINHTDVRSVKASLKANYARKVSIDINTTILSNVRLGYGSYVNMNSWVENADIGRYCSISDNVSICPAEHDISLPLSHPVLGDGLNTEKVIIGNDVLISHGVTILSGTKINDGAVIAAGAVVPKNTIIGEYEIWGGVPAHFIKQRFDSEKINLIKKQSIYNNDWDKNKNMTWKRLKKNNG